jgi:TolA-binding protein
MGFLWTAHATRLLRNARPSKVDKTIKVFRSNGQYTDTGSSSLVTSTETVEGYLDKKAERAQKIASLEAEKASLQSEIADMKEKLEQLEFEKSARILQSEIEGLRTEKSALEDRTRTYEAEAHDAAGNRPSPVTIRAGPAAPGSAGQAPTGQSRVEQARPLREAVPGVNLNQQRVSLAPGIPRTATPVQAQGVKPKVNQ